MGLDTALRGAEMVAGLAGGSPGASSGLGEVGLWRFSNRSSKKGVSVFGLIYPDHVIPVLIIEIFRGLASTRIP